MDISTKDAGFFKISYFFTIMSVITYWLIRIYEYFTIIQQLSNQASSLYYFNAVLVTAVCAAVIIAQAIAFKFIKNVTDNAFWMPTIIMTGYIIAVLIIKEQVSYFFISYLSYCCIGAIYYDWRKLLSFMVLFNVVTLILVLCGVRVSGLSIDFFEMVTNWLIAIVGSLFVVLVAYFSTEKNAKSVLAEDSFITLLRSTPDCIVLTDQNFCITYMSQSFAELLHVEMPFLAKGRPLFDLFSIENKMLISTIIRSNSYYEDTKELTFYNKKDFYKVFSDKLSGTTKGLFLSITNITPIMRAKLEAEHAAKAKSAFLARMSHEIRTPMNAISGMSELILRENINPQILEYASGVKQASANLLSIINDVLDFSKIDSGNMEIIPSTYLFASLINDVITIVRMRLLEKPILFITNIDSHIPNKLIGDVVRIRQIMTNLLSNAIKYTKSGFISLAIEAKRESKNENINDSKVLLRITVSDSGKGIKDKEIGKIFGEFIQIDLESNKGIEGTGLGLAIVKNLCEIMGGDIFVSSEYGKGSVFTVTIPQLVDDPSPVAYVKENEKKSVLVLENRELYASSIEQALKNLNVPCIITNSYSAFNETIMQNTEYTDTNTSDNRSKYAFVSSIFQESAKNLIRKLKTDITLVVLTDHGQISGRSVRSLPMPAHSLSIAQVLNNETTSMFISENELHQIHFTAPEAKILLVDDINTNILVAKGLMSPYRMQIKSALSGKQSIDMVQQEEFDIIFMDHMMPEMDGIEAVTELRKLENAATTPIIALTANAIHGVEEMFLNSGFNALLVKPIEVVKLNEILETWLPKTKIKKANKNLSRTEQAVAHAALLAGGDEGENVLAEESLNKIEKVVESALESVVQTTELKINGVDIKKGCENTGGLLSYYVEVLKTFHVEGINYIEKIKECLESADIHLFTTYIHALKSASMNIGAEALSQEAYMLEKAGKEQNIAAITMNVEPFINKFSELLQNIKMALDNMNLNFIETKQDSDTHNKAPDSLSAMKTVFLVDDNTTNLMIGKNALKNNFKTFTMPSAEKMFELIEKISPDLILLDVEMPEMSGYEAIKILKSGAYSDIPVVFLSAHNGDAEKQEGLDLGAIDYIGKPFKPADLLEKIEKILC